jgi:hypothetical protein
LTTGGLASPVPEAGWPGQGRGKRIDAVIPAHLDPPQQRWEDAEKRGMAATKLTPEGWSGSSSGVWNNKANIVIDDGQGIQVSGSDLIDALAGDDQLIGSRKSGAGVTVPRDPKRGNLQLGGGNDQLSGSSTNDHGIDNRGFIYTGDGNDRITGSGAKTALRNHGFIFTQGGKDVVDVSEGGISGKKDHFVDLGADRDKFLGFGQHYLYGGGGEDLLLLPKGTYTIDRRSSRRAWVEKGKDRLELVDFEQIGSIDGGRNDRIAIDQDGTLVVKANGDITFS